MNGQNQDSDRIYSISRRGFLAAAAGLATVTFSSRRLFAAAAPYTFTHGDFEITVITDGELSGPATTMAFEAPEEERKAFLKSVGLDGETVPLTTNLTLVRSGPDLILFDTGSGANFQPTAGKLSENLAAAGIDPASITKVVFTHGHPDHIWGTIAPDGKLRFPKAAYYSAAAEWDFWNDKDILTKMPKEMHAFVMATQQQYAAVKDVVTMFRPGDDIITGITVLDTKGHTPGHVSFELAGGDGLIIVADVITAAPVYFAHPEWKMGFDAIHEQAIESRQKLLDRAATDKTKLIGYHWPHPGVGYAERKGTAYQYVPAS